MTDPDRYSYLAAIADATPAVIYFMNVQTQKYLYMNPAVKRILGYTSEEITATGPEFIISRIHPDDLNRVMKKHHDKLAALNKESSAVQDQYSHEDEYRLKHANGSWRWFRSTGVVFERTPDGQILSILGVAQDITETKPIGGAGTGLGLSICYGVIKAFDGDIEVQSRLGEGTTFRVTLHPSQAPHSAAAKSMPAAATKAPTHCRGRIMVIDDDALVAESMADVFRPYHDVRVVHSAQAGLDILLAEEGNAYDVILCDLMMPNMNGMDLHSKLGAHNPGLQRRVVFITGGAFSQTTQKFLNDISNQVVEKPYRLHSFRALVQTLVESNRT